jgi:hypothetical protein
MLHDHQLEKDFKRAKNLHPDQVEGDDGTYPNGHVKEETRVANEQSLQLAVVE